MAVDFPGIGETYLGTDPAVVKVKKVTIGASSAGVDIALTATGVYEIFTVPAGTLVLESRTRVSEAFAGSTPTLAIGDTDSCVWNASAIIAPGSTGVLLKKDATGFPGGKIYDAAQAINVTLGDTACTAGILELYVSYADAGLI